jgi:hypothetical protein
MEKERVGHQIMFKLKSSVFWDTAPCSPMKVMLLEEHVASTFRVEE